MKEELADECNYSREASFLRRFGSPAYLGDDPRFKVPWVWDGSTDRVLVMERMKGVSVGEQDVESLSQKERDDVRLATLMSPTPSINWQRTDDRSPRE
jgi:aarF domain-containing kinase